MSGRSQILEVARREVTVRARTKAFQVITALLLLIAIAIPVAIAVWPESDDLEEVDLGIVGADVDVDAIEEQLDALAVDRFDFSVVQLASDEVDAALIDDTVDVVVEPGPVLAWKDEVDPDLGFLVDSLLRQNSVIERGVEAGLAPEEVAGLLSPVEIGERFVEEPDEDVAVASALAFVSLMTAFAVPQVFGNLAMMSVVEEKASGVVEVLLSHIRPRTLLGGKILGIGFLAVCQVAIVLLGTLAALLLTADVDLPDSAWSFLPIFAVSVLGGLGIYLTLFALLGSLISRQEDAAQVMVPVFVPLMGGYFAGQIAAFGDADNLVSRILTFVPLTTPLLLPVRVARDAIAPWEIVVSLVLLLVAIVVLVRVAGRLYEFTLLHKGTRIGWGTAVKAMLRPDSVR